MQISNGFIDNNDEEDTTDERLTMLEGEVYDLQEEIKGIKIELETRIKEIEELKTDKFREYCNERNMDIDEEESELNGYGFEEFWKE